MHFVRLPEEHFAGFDQAPGQIHLLLFSCSFDILALGGRSNVVLSSEAEFGFLGLVLVEGALCVVEFGLQGREHFLYLGRSVGVVVLVRTLLQRLK